MPLIARNKVTIGERVFVEEWHDWVTPRGVRAQRRHYTIDGRRVARKIWITAANLALAAENAATTKELNNGSQTPR